MGRIPIVLVLVLGTILSLVQTTHPFFDSAFLDGLGYFASSLMALVAGWQIVAGVLRSPRAFIDWLSHDTPPEEDLRPSVPRSP